MSYDLNPQVPLLNSDDFSKSAKMTLFPNPITETNPLYNITISELFVKVKSQEYKNIINHIRGLSDKSEQRDCKNLSLQSVTPSGVFSKRNQKNIQEHSGVLCLDFDDLSDLERFKNQLITDEVIDTLILFLSPSGNGLKWFIRIPACSNTHVLYFDAVKEYISFKYNIQVDKKCRNISRACYLSYDPNAYQNPNPTKELDQAFLSKWSPVHKEIVQFNYNDSLEYDEKTIKVKSLVNQITESQINIAEDYEDWIKIGFALCELEEAGLPFFHMISMQSKKYDKDEVEEKFHQLLNAYDGQIKLGSLFYIASNYDLHPIGVEDDVIVPAPNYKLPRTAQERMSQAKKMPQLVKLLGNIWCKEEIHILFGDNGTGKSVWATQIADALSRGKNAMPHLINEAGPQKVLFYDFELSDRQFFNRYTDNDGNEYSFSNNLTIDNIDFNELAQTGKKIKIDKLIIDKIVHDIEILKPDVLIVDNITFLKTEANQDANVALELIKSLISIKREFKISIMILAHTPKVKPGMIITNNDLAGSKHISNLVDSISAIGQSALERTDKYIKSIKCRSTEMEFDAKNVIVARLEKQNTFLKFNYQDQGNEFDLIRDPQKVAQLEDDKLMRQEVIRLHLKGETTRAIEDQTGVSKSTASRIINSYKIDDNILL